MNTRLSYMSFRIGSLLDSRRSSDIHFCSSAQSFLSTIAHCLIPSFDGAFLSPIRRMRYGVLHGCATTTEAVRRAIQNSHVWTAPADQGFVFGSGTFAGAVMSPAFCAVFPKTVEVTQHFSFFGPASYLKISLSSAALFPGIQIAHGEVVNVYGDGGRVKQLTVSVWIRRRGTQPSLSGAGA